MEAVTHQIRLANWLPIIQECRSSGMTVKAWCSQNNINEKQFYYWQRRIRKEAANELQLTVAKNSGPFVELAPPAEVPADTAADIILHVGNFQLDIRNSASPALLEHLLRVVSHAE